jgi:hypothetical protein
MLWLILTFLQGFSEFLYKKFQNLKILNMRCFETFKEHFFQIMKFWIFKISIKKFQLKNFKIQIYKYDVIWKTSKRIQFLKLSPSILYLAKVIAVPV